MLLDLNMWKNQIMYTPLDFGQYVGPDGRIWSVRDEFSIKSHYKNTTVFSYEWRKLTIDPITNKTFNADDYVTDSRYRETAFAVKALAFIPSIFVFIMFGVLIWIFGREGTDSFESPGSKKMGVSVTSIRINKSIKRNQTGSTRNIVDDSDNVNNDYGSIKLSPSPNAATEEKPIGIDIYDIADKEKDEIVPNVSSAQIV